MARSSKGSQFERTFAKKLSLWWTDNERDDVFWRSSNSGGRATVRRQAGTTTFMQAGDIAAIDPIGLPLLEVITLELKRGYSKTTVAEAFDKLPSHKDTLWEQFVTQAIQSHKDNGSFAWMLVTARDRRCPLVWFPGRLGVAMRNVGIPKPMVEYRHHIGLICGMTLEQWFDQVTPQDIMEIKEIQND